MYPSFLVAFIHTYGLMLAIGFYAGWFLAARRARAFGENPDVIGNLVLLSILGGVVGARILHFALYKRPGDTLWALFRVWEGGLVFYGGLIGAGLADLLYLRLRHLNMWRFADICAPSIAIGQAFGRIGCFLNGCCFGGPATDAFPFAVRFPGLSVGNDGSPPFADHAFRGWIDKATATASLPVHPTELYAALNLFLIAALLVAATPLRRRQGQLLGWVAILNALQRFAVELVRHDTPPGLLGLKPGQLGAIVVFLCGLAILLWTRSHGGAPAQPAPGHA